MVEIERSMDGRWWISENGWGRPIGCFCKALEEAQEVYPGKSYAVLDMRR